MKLIRAAIAAAIIGLPVMTISVADEIAEATQDGSDQERSLDEIFIDEDARQTEPQPTTGRINIQPIPVKFGRGPPLFQHNSIEMIVRPVRITEDGTYEFDADKGQDFSAISVTLNRDGKIQGSRLRRPDEGKRNLDLPEAIYAITEVLYLVSNPIGNTNLFFDPPFDYRFCLAERTIAFDVRSGETTDLGRLIIRGLERQFRKNGREHRPILGSDAPFVDISDPGFRNKAPELASAGVISFNPDGELCRDSSREVPGWFTNEELAEELPNVVASNTAAQSK